VKIFNYSITRKCLEEWIGVLSIFSRITTMDHVTTDIQIVQVRVFQPWTSESQTFMMYQHEKRYTKWRVHRRKLPHVCPLRVWTNELDDTPNNAERLGKFLLATLRLDESQSREFREVFIRQQHIDKPPNSYLQVVNILRTRLAKGLLTVDTIEKLTESAPYTTKIIHGSLQIIPLYSRNSDFRMLEYRWS